ncbi:hypothetical protein SK803_22645 [Lentzea sp. BCCO 10_0856]|uniref:Uncharacterized protein n=1 Tax=Lentzea miocenica TaxID=3095431 RepID=A0ABU4T4J3_9PSEU|nr:hypothetical protein [Lentzea sp. BCCO 10_0856]MDX8033025.1 hypothetical protein [Lentzea sp. BCCO 10_0856]
MLRSAVFGALAGLVGGLVFGVVMALVGFLPTVAAIVRTDSPVVGFAIHMVFAGIIGVIFGILVARQRELLFWGLTYGVLWWFMGPLTLLPLLLGRPVTWDVAAAQALLPSLFGHLVYGAVTAGVLMLLHENRPSRREGTGPALIRGAAFGFVGWVLVAVTISPLLDGRGLEWTPPAVRTAIAWLPPFLLCGAGVALSFSWLSSLSRAVLSDDVRQVRSRRLAGGKVISLWHGVLAGLAGGVIFTGVMVAVGFLPVVASLVGARSAVTGLVLHLLISQVVGVTYAVFFRRRSFDAASGIGWGVSYGFLWWVLGNLTLLPLLLGSSPQWTSAALALSFPSLVGHLAYGAVLGLVYQRLEQRVSPWHLTRSEAVAARSAARQEQTLSAAPALWSLITCVALLIPVLVA